jgi:hypothetical protein
VFNRISKTPEAHELDGAITDTISEFKGSETGSEEQARLADIIKTLMELRAADKANVKPALSADVIASIAANLLGIGFIPKIKI